MTHTQAPGATTDSPGWTRRCFLQSGVFATASVLASARFAAATSAGEGSSNGRNGRFPDCCDATVLVLIQLAGGNDGLSMVIPYTDDLYFASRPGLAIRPAAALKINDELALNGVLTGFHELYQSGELALVPGVGYPNPSHSHFRSTEIWRTASDSQTVQSKSWLARSLGAHFIWKWTDILRMAKRLRSSTSSPCQLANGLGVVSRLISAGTPVRAFCLWQGGYDTHSGQRISHQRLLEDLDRAVKAFVKDLKARGNFKRVLVVIFSEFGRGLAENRDGGTDHGAAAPVLIAGGEVRGGVHGRQPSLTDLVGGGLVHNVDFRSVYATVLEKWLRVQSQSILGGEFVRLPFL